MPSELTRLAPTPRGHASGAASGADGSVIGVACVALSAQCFAFSAALAKWVDVNAIFYNFAVRPIVWALSSLSVVLAWQLLKGPSLRERFVGVPGKKALLLQRGVVSYAFNILWFFSLTLMPVGDATCIVFTLGPLGTGFYAWRLLGEPVPAKLLLVGAANIVGSTLVLQPSIIFGSVAKAHASTYAVGASMAAACGVAAGLLPILSRLLAGVHWTTVQHTSDFLSTTILTPLSLAVFAVVNGPAFSASGDSLFCVLGAVTYTCEPSSYDGEPRPRPYALVALVCNAFVLFLGLSLQTYGYQHVTHAQRASMTTYLEIPTAFLLQHLVFGDRVNILAALGASIIVLASIVNLALQPPVPPAKDSGSA